MSYDAGIDILVGELRLGFEQLHRDMIHAQVLVEEMTDQIAQSMQKIGQSASSVDTLSNSLYGMAGNLAVVGTAFSAVSVGIEQLVEKSLMAAGQMEQARVAMMTFTKDAKEADGILRYLMDFAVKTPFEIKGLTAATRQMIGFGFETKEIPRMLKVLGDAVAATGEASEDRMRRLVLAFGEMKNRGVAAMKEINQVGFLGIPGLKMLADEFETTTKRITEGTKKRAIDANEAIGALMQAFEKKFSGAMEAQSQTLLGRLSNLKDAAYITFIDIGNVLLPIGKLFATMGFDILAGVSNVAKAFGQLGDGTKVVIVSMVAAVVAIGPIVLALAGLAGVAAALVNPFSLAVLAIGGVAVAFAGLAAAVVMSWPGIKAVLANLKTDFDAFIEGLKVDFSTSGIGKFFESLAKECESAGTILDRLLGIVKQWGHAFLSAFDALTGIPTFFRSIWEVCQKLTGDAFQTILKNAEVFGAGLLSMLGAVGQGLMIPVKLMMDVMKNLTGAAKSFMAGFSDSMIQAIPGAGPFLVMLKSLATNYGDVFEKSMKSAIGLQEWGQITDKVFQGLKGAGSQILESFRGALDGMGTAAKKSGKSLEELGNSFLAWVNATERSIEATVRFTTVQKQATRDRLDDLRSFGAAHDAEARKVLASLESLAETEKAWTGAVTQGTQEKINALKQYVAALEQARLQEVANTASVEFDKLPVSLNNATGAMKGLSIETDRIINGGWKVLGHDMETMEKTVIQLGRDLKITLDLEDPLQKVSRLWTNFTRVQESGMVTTAKVREIFIATFTEVAAQINKAADQMHLFEVSFTTFFTTKMQAAAMNIELAFLKISNTLRDNNRKVFDDFIDKGASMEQVLGKLWGNLRNAFNDIWKSALKEIAHVFADVMTEMERLVLGVFKDLMMNVLRGILGQFMDIDKAVQGITKRVTSELIPALGGGQTSQIAFPQAGGAVQAGTQAKGAVQTLASGSLLGTLNLVADAFQAVFGALSYFQGRRMEQDIGRIEVTSREIKALIEYANRWIQKGGDAAEFCAARLGEAVAALAVIGEGIYAMVEPVKSIEAILRDHVQPTLEALASLMSGGTVNINPTGGARVGSDVWVVNWQPAVDALNMIIRVNQEWLPQINDRTAQGLSAVSLNITSGFAMTVSAIQVGVKAIVVAVLNGQNVTANGMTVNGNIHIGANVDQLGAQVMSRIGQYQRS